MSLLRFPVEQQGTYMIANFQHARMSGILDFYACSVDIYIEPHRLATDVCFLETSVHESLL